jgi:hypothetical protein
MIILAGSECSRRIFHSRLPGFRVTRHYWSNWNLVEGNSLRRKSLGEAQPAYHGRLPGSEGLPGLMVLTVAYSALGFGLKPSEAQPNQPIYHGRLLRFGGLPGLIVPTVAYPALFNWNLVGVMPRAKPKRNHGRLPGLGVLCEDGPARTYRCYP